MSKKRHTWDWEAYALLKEWQPKCEPENMRVGQCLRHGKDRWLVFGAFEGDLIIAMDGDEPVVVPANECRRGWDPEIDPITFAAELHRRKSEKKSANAV